MKKVRPWRWPLLETRRRVPPKARAAAPLAKDLRKKEPASSPVMVVGEQDDFSDTLPRVFWPELRS